MFLCPACGRNEIGPFSKLWATAYSPAACRACGATSAEPAWARRVAGLLWGLLPLVLIAWFLLAPESLGMMLVPKAALVAVEVLFYLRLPLHAVGTVTVRRGRLIALIVSGGLLAAVVLAALLN